MMKHMARTCSLLLSAVLMLSTSGASAAQLKMPQGMGGVPDIGAIPCSLFSEMTVVAPLGTRHSLLTWAAGYLSAVSGKTLEQIASAASTGQQAWDYARIAGHLATYCTEHPKAITREAVLDLGQQLGLEVSAAPGGAVEAKEQS